MKKSFLLTISPLKKGRPRGFNQAKGGITTLPASKLADEAAPFKHQKQGLKDKNP